MQEVKFGSQGLPHLHPHSWELPSTSKSYYFLESPGQPQLPDLMIWG